MIDPEMEDTASANTPDPVDKACLIEQGERVIALRSVQERLKPQTHPDFDGESCLDCGAEMPAQRLADGRIRCTGCQTAHEKRSKFFRS